MLKPLGFFEEIFSDAPEGVSAGRLLESIPETPERDSADIARYLKSGHGIFDTMGAERDVVSGEKWIIGAASLQTDGDWVWRVDLAYYMRRYGVTLPDEFTDHVRDIRYTVPEIPEAHLAELAFEVLPQLGFRKDGGAGRQQS